ncbi:MAG: GIDE domain-containing protein, partial [Candidatus Wallbacteria bacterium]|nr:GIDE domain-containing protein [Candidatus Wallbacteria bacterium]
LVEVTGTAMQRKLINSPMLQKACAYYKWKVEKLVKTKNSSHWREIGGGESREPFYLEDETGRAIVFPAGAELNLVNDYQQVFGSFSTLPPNLNRFLTEQRISGSSFFGLRSKLRFSETFVAPRDKLYVLGTAHFRQKKADLEHSGAADEKTAIMMREIEENDSHCAASIVKGENTKWFYISDRSEKQIVSSMGWWVPLSIWGGPLLSAGCLAYVLYRFTGS